MLDPEQWALRCLVSQADKAAFIVGYPADEAGPPPAADRRGHHHYCAYRGCKTRVEPDVEHCTRTTAEGEGDGEWRCGLLTAGDEVEALRPRQIVSVEC